MSWGSKASGVLRGLSAVCLGAAVVLLVWAGGLAVWSRQAPQPVRTVVTAVSYRASQAWGDKSIELITMWVLAIVVVMLGTLAIMWWQRAAGGWIIGVVAPLTVLFCMFFVGVGLSEVYRSVQRYPVTPKWPMAVMGWWMVAAGVVGVILAVPAVASYSRNSRWFVGIGVLMAVVVAGCATVSAARAGDDSKFVDATTASAAEIPPSPDRLGQRAFTLRISSDSKTGRENLRWRVEKAGAGFVTLGDGRVTAYGSDGVERWHYQRNGPGGFGAADIAVFDGGETVVVNHYGSVLVGLDAMTGRELWRSSDTDLVGAFSDSQRWTSRTTYLLSTDKKRTKWTRYDTRTGKPMWTVPAPSTECDGWDGGRSVIPVSAYRCIADNIATVRIVDVDPQTGQIRWKSTLSDDVTFDGVRPPAKQVDVGSEKAGRDGALVDVRDRREYRSTVTTYVNTINHQIQDLGGKVYLYWTHDDSEEFLASGPWPSQDFRLRGPDGQARCSFPEKPRANLLAAQAVILGQQVVFADKELKVFNRNDCAPVATLPTPEYTRQIVAAPGVVLVVRTDATGTYVDGYR